ncbi:MAG TPA: type II toxin-antitoxin system VapC family toxin [Steroidobacteraceae bacterium]|nr:type II toxin-antitoxin system VapC family toxin [Steroidobacteraceae bacterium]
MIEKTRRFIEHCDRTSEEIMVPSVVVSEYLTTFSPTQVAQQVQEFHRRFFVAPLDAAAGALAAQLANAVRTNGLNVGERHVLKSDCYIIATAIVHGADAIVTGNVAEFRSLTGGRIKVLDIPDVPTQLNMRTRSWRCTFGIAILGWRMMQAKFG